MGLNHTHPLPTFFGSVGYFSHQHANTPHAKLLPAPPKPYTQATLHPLIPRKTHSHLQNHLPIPCKSCTHLQSHQLHTYPHLKTLHTSHSTPTHPLQTLLPPTKPPPTLKPLLLQGSTLIR